MKNAHVRIFSILAIALICAFAAAPAAYAAAPDYRPNLTVGTELVGADPAKWQQDGNLYTYEGTSYEFSVDFSGGSASDATLTLTEGDYSGYYQYTAEDGTLRETGAVISVNYVFDSSLSPVNELRIESIDAGGMEIDMLAHDPNANTWYSDTISTDICYGGIWANDCDLSLSTANSSVITSSED